MQSRIAWSYSGLIAYIDDQSKVFVTWLVFQNGCKYTFANPVPVPVPSEGKPVSINFSSTNFDLAINDDLGRIHIYTIGVSGTPSSQIVASAVRDQRPRLAELDRLVRVHFLKNQNSERQGFIPVNPMKPFVPVRVKSSLVAVNGNGMLRLLLQSDDFRYSEVDELIPGVLSVRNAAFYELEFNKLLVVVATNDNLLSIHEAVISATDKQIKLTINEIAKTNLQNTQLVALNVFKTGLGLCVRAVYQSYFLDFSLQETQESLHHSFFELFTASDPVPPDPVKVWRLNSDFKRTEFTGGDVKRVFLVNNTEVVVHFNGEVFTNFIDNTKTSILKFKPDQLNGINEMCVSPNLCCIAYLNKEGKLKTTGITADNLNDENVAVALATCFAQSVLTSTSSEDVVKVCFEVLLNVENKEKLFNAISLETQKLLEVSLNAPEDPGKTEILVTNPSKFQSWLSLLSSLGTLEGWHKSPGGLMCFILMHLHQLSFSVTWTMRRITQKPRASSFEQYRMEIQASQYHLTTMFGPVRWVTDLIVRIAQELYSALKSKNPVEYIMSKPNVYCAMLMSSISRYLLRYFLRAIRTLNGAAKTLTELEGRVNAKLSNVAQASQDSNVISEARASLSSPSNYIATHAFKKLVAQLQSLPVKLDIFEKFILNIEEKYKLLVTNTKIPLEVRNNLESEVVISAKIPSKLVQLVELALETSNKVMFPNLDIPNLYFHDTTWLGLEGACDEQIDGIRKRIILPQESAQVCSRCNIKTIYGPDVAKQPTHWHYVFQRFCICGGTWERTVR